MTACPSSGTSGRFTRAVGPARRVVVKVGTNLLTGGRDSIDEAVIAALVGQVARVRSAGIEPIIVSSGAVAAGREALAASRQKSRLNRRSLSYRQALASLGQTRLMRVYERLFEEHGIIVGQALISRGDLQSRLGYLNVRNTLEALMAVGAVPVVNENDVVAVEEIEGDVFGDNDRLSAMVANAVDAELLILLGEVDGLYTADPALVPDAALIPVISHIDTEIEAAAGEARDGRGRGGMASKVAAARLATASGTAVVVASGHVPDVITRLCQGERIGTTFKPAASRTESRKRWMLTGVAESRGGVSVDAGAARALIEAGHSLLPAGIVAVQGGFRRGDIIAITGPDGRTLAWGLANYPATDLELIKGKKSAEVFSLLGREYGPEVVHRNNMALA